MGIMERGVLFFYDTNKKCPRRMHVLVVISPSSLKWTVLAHFESQPRGQKFQAKIQWTALAHFGLGSIKIDVIKI